MFEDAFRWVASNKEWFLSGLGVAVASALVAIGSAVFRTLSGRSSGEFSGRWRIVIEGQSEDACNGHMLLFHLGPWVWGKSEHYSAEKNGAPLIRKFRYFGKYQREQAILRFFEETKDKRMVGATVLWLEGGGKIVHGCNAFWHHKNHRMTSQMFTLSPAIG